MPPLVVRLSGDLDISRYPELREKLSAIPLSRRPVLIDLAEANTVDSVCMRELLLAKRRLERDDRRVAVLVESANVLRILAIADVTAILNIFSDRAKAMRWLEIQD